MSEIINNEFLIRAFTYIDTRAEGYACNAIEALMENPGRFNRFQFINRLADEIAEKLWDVDVDMPVEILAKVEDYLDAKIESLWDKATSQFVSISDGKSEIEFANWRLINGGTV